MLDLNKERELFLNFHYEQYLKENPEVDKENAKYIYDYAHKNMLVEQLRESHFIVWLASKAQAVPENHIVVPRTREVVVAIEKIVQQQCDASGVQEPLHRLDGWRILEEIAEKVEEIK
ncbi:hypothetical protein ABTK81_15355 [Acinetobacter baumannii]